MPGADPQAKARERVKTLGLLQIILGGLGLVGLLYSYLLRFLAHDPVSRRLQDLLWTGEIGDYLMASLTLGAGLAILMIGTGIAVSKRAPIGRTLTFVHAVSAVLVNVGSQYLNFTLVYPALERFAETGGPVARAGAMGGFIGGLMGSVLGLAFPFVELYLVTRPGTREAFDG